MKKLIITSLVALNICGNVFSQNLNVTILSSAIVINNDSTINSGEMGVMQYHICQWKSLTINQIGYKTFYLNEGSELYINAQTWDTFIYLKSTSKLVLTNVNYGYQLNVYYEEGATIIDSTTTGVQAYYHKYQTINYDYTNFPNGNPCIISDIDNLKKQEFAKVFPNPSNGLINIESEKQIKKISIYDLMGRTIFESTNNNLNTSKIDLTKSSKGLYLIDIQYTDKTTDRRKILVD